ncbi:GNAT family N-acetyltransferase [Agromyces seonyuensis]|uniref:GNAT family N-acetyltransferase n=1 Tax=Agromyces seonyuensis TaxID=2662446 RepID=A0A6I4P3H9_9MICO|nr:GNAT family N-acetyltransferase [Agromyces seonyuensis]
MRTIVSDRLCLRPWEETDADFLFDLESRPETVRYLGPHAKPMTERSEAIASIHRRRALDHHVHGIWAVTVKATGDLVGNLLLKPIPLSTGTGGDAPVEIGWHLHPNAQGAGYATEAAQAVLADASTRGLLLAIAVTDPRNAASQRVCRRLGMQERGVTKAYYDETNLLFTKALSATPSEHRTPPPRANSKAPAAGHGRDLCH